MEEDTDKNGIKSGKDPITGRFVEGNPGGGRPKGSVDFKTKWLKFIDKIAEQNNITPDEVDKQMLTVAYRQMQSGDFRYWKDIQDRIYGTAVHNTDIKSDGQRINSLKELPDDELINIATGGETRTG